MMITVSKQNSVEMVHLRDVKALVLLGQAMSWANSHLSLIPC